MSNSDRNLRRKPVRHGSAMKTEDITSKGQVDVSPKTTKTQSLIKGLIANLQNWTEVYFWVPVAFLSIYVLSLSAYWLSGRAPRVNLDWMPELGVNLFKAVCAIVLTSITKEALWGWMTMQSKTKSPWFAWARMVVEALTLLLFVWVLFNH